MNPYKKIVLEFNDILTQANSIDNEQLKETFLVSHTETIHAFMNSLNDILGLYQFKENGNEQQNNVSDLFSHDIDLLLQNSKTIQKQPQFKYLASNLFDSLSYSENKFAFNLQYSSDTSVQKAAISYLKDRNTHLKALESSGYLQDESLNGSSARKYFSNKYESNMLGHALMYIKNNFLHMDKSDIVQIIKMIDDSNFFNKLIQTPENQRDFYDKNLIFQYSDTILKLKAIFIPEKLTEDTFVQALWNGKIHDTKTIQTIIKNVPLWSVATLLQSDFSHCNSDFLEIANHLKQVNFSDKDISFVMSTLLKECPISEVANILSEINIPNTSRDFIDGEYSKKYSWMLEGNFFHDIKSKEKDIENATEPFLPAEYYIKKLDTIRHLSQENSHFVQNLTMLLNSDTYTEAEKKSLIVALKRNNLYSPFITDEKIEFNEYDAPDVQHTKILKSYFSGQVIPMEISIPIIKQLIEHPQSDFPYAHEIAEACIVSVASNTLKEKGVDIGNHVFFGNDRSGTRGCYNNTHKYIWLNDSLVTQLINNPDPAKRVDIFSTVFHEMQHAIQYHNIENNKIDYLTYCFIKEDVLEEYDRTFYNANYKAIYMEADARREGTLGSLEFLNQLASNFVPLISNEAENNYITEASLHTLYKDSQKQMGVGKNGTTIDISQYVGLLIQNNPKILLENPILSLEYNTDGSQKDAGTLLKDFEQKKSDKSVNLENLKSIYYGLISKIPEHNYSKAPNISYKVQTFLREESRLITAKDMRLLYQEVPLLSRTDIYKRLYQATHDIQPIQSSQNKPLSQNTEELDEHSSR